MLLSQVLPLLPEPKIQIMFSGLAEVSPLPSLARSLVVSGEISAYLPFSQR